ncbi:DNA glycosylase AlkZ-like family protein [Vibrio mangrovi]|uniref:Crosslink repair DNA glycosylase YcaQ family protein n=1 Tax=Vibrio mangrovi TaxID=474394 RepID=A0A1Y6IUH0_9VIBR|nr:crosslink repair DNA glycosylase YcaQ family protein [Vibrio mangrovi]MDW6003513.1 crosslink repair DNA glycosylase YcaQ family protein [Vibrio mangrovi]SMR99693.1 hypothetical protein VIM7927_00921 [Vibrio mangrovi]
MAQLINMFSKNLCRWLEKNHFEIFDNSSISEMSEAYLGVYANRPTSWLAILSRNSNLDMNTAIASEEECGLARVPAMRRSKFIAPLKLANQLFYATKSSPESHEWRLTDVGLTMGDYQRLFPKILLLAKEKAVKPKDVAISLSIQPAEARALINVATYMGDMVRIPSTSPWSNQWKYAPAPTSFGHDNSDMDTVKISIISRYIDHYGPVTTNDIAWWTGFKKQEIASLLPSINAIEVDSGIWMTKSKIEQFCCLEKENGTESREVRFLPAWDPLLMGYAPDSLVRTCLNLQQIGAYDSSGNGRPVIFLGSRAVACWQIKVVKSKRYMWIDKSGDSITNELDIIEQAAKEWAKRIDVIYLSDAPVS